MASTLVWVARRHHLPLLRLSRCSSLTQTLFSTSRREFSSLPSNERSVVLYERENGRNTAARSLLAFSLFHTGYWAWYVVDFIPAVNSSPMQDLHVDPVLGYVGLTFAAVVNVSTIFYTKSLISRIVLAENDDEEGTKAVQLYLHNFPWINPSDNCLSYSLGDVEIDPSSTESKKLVADPNHSLASFRGHLPLKVAGRRYPCLLDIGSTSEVKKSLLLLQVLTDPAFLLRPKRKPKVMPKKRKARRR